jgi:hypothetical protein
VAAGLEPATTGLTIGSNAETFFTPPSLLSSLEVTRIRIWFIAIQYGARSFARPWFRPRDYVSSATRMPTIVTAVTPARCPMR